MKLRAIKNDRDDGLAAGRKFQIIDGCTVAAFAGSEKPGAVFSKSNEDGDRESEHFYC